jgi:hypothetical protein
MPADGLTVPSPAGDHLRLSLLLIIAGGDAICQGSWSPAPPTFGLEIAFALRQTRLTSANADRRQGRTRLRRASGRTFHPALAWYYITERQNQRGAVARPASLPVAWPRPTRRHGRGQNAERATDGPAGPRGARPAGTINSPAAARSCGGQT